MKGLFIASLVCHGLFFPNVFGYGIAYLRMLQTVFIILAASDTLVKIKHCIMCSHMTLSMHVLVRDKHAQQQQTL